MNITDSEFLLFRQNRQNMINAQSIINQQASSHRAREAALRRQLAAALEELEAERGRRRYLQFQLTRATN